MELKDYKAIAKIIKGVNDYESDGPEGDIAKGLADYFEKENPKSGIHQSNLSSNTWFCNRCKYEVKPQNFCRCNPFKRKQFLKNCGIE